MPDKSAVIRNFSKSACRYDEHAAIQRFAAEQLIEEISGKDFRKILEIGCGTGIYTRLLAERFGSGSIRAVDISENMITRARENIQDINVSFEVGDAEKIELEKGYDLITSNSAIQWFDSVENALQRYSVVLNKGGWLVFSSFGPRTFTELASALKNTRMDKEYCVPSVRFPDGRELRLLLLKHLSTASVREIMVDKEYPSLRDLLEHIKYTGTRGCVTGCSPIWSRGLLKSVEDAYVNSFGRIRATYQIFLCRAVR